MDTAFTVTIWYFWGAVTFGVRGCNCIVFKRNIINHVFTAIGPLNLTGNEFVKESEEKKRIDGI